MLSSFFLCLCCRLPFRLVDGNQRIDHDIAKLLDAVGVLPAPIFAGFGVVKHLWPGIS